ncbi:MAG: excinuclease ABC subunit UvrA [Bacilli bacterium]
MNDKIIIKGARENNLKNIDLELPKNKLIVMTGVSGSGKSSLAFDTIYNEGQRRYVESLSAYARQFLGGNEKPDVDSIEGLSPAISIDQKTTNRNPRSTVGTITEIYDYLRLLYARIGIPHCPVHKKPISSQSIEEMVQQVMKEEDGTKLLILSPIVEGEKGTHKELFSKLLKDGFTRVIVNDNMYDLTEDIELEKNKKDNISVVIDRIVLKSESKSRLYDSIENACKLSRGKVIVDCLDKKKILMSEQFACNECDFSLSKLEPRMFSFNSPFGACEDCAGLGIYNKISVDLIIPNKDISINEGAIKTLNIDDTRNIYYQLLRICCEEYGIDLNKKVKDLTKKELNIVLYGSPDRIRFNFKTNGKSTYNALERYEGVCNNLERRYLETNSAYIREWISGFMSEKPCETCSGDRLKESILNVLINSINIADITKLSIGDMLVFFKTIELDETKKEISKLIIKEIESRLTFLVNVGLDYLTLNRSAGTLSGGEAQRIRLATQIGSKLTGVLYVLDEPSIGLHQRDNERLINTLLEMKELGNTLIVVEHDTDTMLASDYLVDIGPRAGVHGGRVISKGTPKEVMEDENSITGQYLSGKRKIELPKTLRKGNKKYLQVKGASENNLKNINVKFPLGKFICVTGVSGSGKSTLVNDILYKKIATYLYPSKEVPGAHKEVKGLDLIDKVVDISQTPIGKTPRSNPATYTGVFDKIRDLFTETKEAKIRGYKKGRFSFNVKGGRCEVCSGDGVKKIEMHFLPDVYIPCEVCGGTRFNSETLEVKFRGKNIAELLDMTVEDAFDYFDGLEKIQRPLKTLIDVGLDYIKLGQSSTTLSGGEAARVKLAKELQKKPTGKSVFILDEPSTGLHTEDISKLLKILHRIADNGDTVIVIEHNLDIIKVSDHIIDLGPEGGFRGGQIIFEGTPFECTKCNISHTGKFLKKEFE